MDIYENIDTIRNYWDHLWRPCGELYFKKLPEEEELGSVDIYLVFSKTLTVGGAILGLLNLVQTFSLDRLDVYSSWRQNQSPNRPLAL